VGSLDDVADELGRLIERLADAAMEALRSGLDEGTAEAAALATKREKLLNRARSSVEKARMLVHQADD